MRTFLSFFLAMALFSPSLWAFQAECMIPGKKFVACDVAVLEGDLLIQYTQEENKKLDQTIAGTKIRKIAIGKANRQSAEKTFLFGPLMFFSFLDREGRGKETVGIDYLTPKGKLKFLLFRLPSSDAYTFGTSLRKISSPR